MSPALPLLLKEFPLLGVADSILARLAISLDSLLIGAVNREHRDSPLKELDLKYTFTESRDWFRLIHILNIIGDKSHEG